MKISQISLFLFSFSFFQIFAQQGIYCDSLSSNDSIIVLNIGQDSILFNLDYSASNHSVNGGIYVIQRITLEADSIIDSTFVRYQSKQNQLTTYVYPSQTTVVDLFFTNRAIPINYTVKGTYTIMSQDTCTLPIILTYNATLGLSNITKEQDVKITPNPFFDRIQLNTEKQITDIQIFNSAGEKIYSQENKNISHTINLQHLKLGIYFIKVRFKNGAVQTKKLVKQ